MHDDDNVHDTTTTTLPCVNTTTTMTGCPWPMPRRHDGDNEDNKWDKGDNDEEEEAGGHDEGC